MKKVTEKMFPSVSMDVLIVSDKNVSMYLVAFFKSFLMTYSMSKTDKYVKRYT